MLKSAAIAILVLVGATLLYASTRPDHFRIERSVLIRSSPAAIFPLVNNFRHWEQWSPWEKVDAKLQRSYSGAPQGQGAIYEWNGNKDVGRGRMEITESMAPTQITLKLDFITPFEAHNTVQFTFKPQGDATLVTQAMFGPSPFLSKLMGLFFSMETMVGSKYEEGLAALKAIAEKP
ncbi:MAG: hypothetical protein RI907_1113 [Pseudomonadota bacterium]